MYGDWNKSKMEAMYDMFELAADRLEDQVQELNFGGDQDSPNLLRSIIYDCDRFATEFDEMAGRFNEIASDATDLLEELLADGVYE